MSEPDDEDPALPDGFENLEHERYGPVGRCIYCGAADEPLTDEHIVPKGLDGTAVLEKASCDRCRRITSAVERDILRGPRDPDTGTTAITREMWHVRSHVDLGSGEDRPETGEVVIVRDGEEETVELPLGEYPILLHLPGLPPPAYLTGRDLEGAMNLEGWVTLSFGPSPAEVCERLGADQIKVTANEDWVTFARMIAKIAYAYTVAKKGLDGFGDEFVTPDILGERDTIGRWVGSHPGRTLEPDSGLRHRLTVFEEEDRGLLLGEVRLLANSQTPSYLVVLGTPA